MMMSPTALIDTAGPGALPGAPGEVDNGAPDGGGGVCPVAADVPLCPPVVVHAAVSNIRVSSVDTRRQRGGRPAGAGRRAASMLVLWALADGRTGTVADRTCAGFSSQRRHPFATPTARAQPRAPNDRARPRTAAAPFDVPTEPTSGKRLDPGHKRGPNRCGRQHRDAGGASR